MYKQMQVQLLRIFNTKEGLAFAACVVSCQIEEKEMYVQRQLVLKELDAVRNREADLRQRMETFQKYDSDSGSVPPKCRSFHRHILQLSRGMDLKRYVNWLICIHYSDTSNYKFEHFCGSII